MQAIALEEAETKIRQVVKNEFFKGTSKAAIDRYVMAIILEALRSITVQTLKTAGFQSLLNFYNRQYNELQRSFGWQLPLFAAVMLLNGKTPTGARIRPTQAQKNLAVNRLVEGGVSVPEELLGNVRTLGVPLQKFTEDYFRQYVRPALERLAKQYPLDPDDNTGRISLRNKAEFEVRYNYQQDQIKDFKTRGVKLVICSTHADCSERCAPYQGRVYSLDGTSGVTDDGRSYVPLEYATNNPRDRYVTKAGTIWQNGLLGFNCRHFLIEYKSGYRFPQPDVEEERRQYAITEEQRRLERLVRKWRTVAVTNQGQDEAVYKKARKKAIQWNKAYIEFSKQNHRAYYPSRTRIFEYDGRII